MVERNDIQRGMVVRSRDGAQVGRIIDVMNDGLVVEKGAFFTRDYFIPYREVQAVSGEGVLLAQTREHLARMHRQEAPVHTHAGTVASVDATGALSLGPTDLEEARMDSAKFQDHGRYMPGAGRHEVPTTAGMYASAPSGALGLGPTDLTEARMDSAKFQDHGQYDVRPTGAAAHEHVHEHLGPERRASGPGWDALDEEEEKKAPVTGGPDTDTKTRY